MEDDRLLALVPVPLLDGESILEVFYAINLPIPFPRPHQELEAVAKYKLESEYIALNLARTKFMLVAADEAERCKSNALGICDSGSPIYIYVGTTDCAYWSYLWEVQGESSKLTGWKC